MVDWKITLIHDWALWIIIQNLVLTINNFCSFLVSSYYYHQLSTLALYSSVIEIANKKKIRTKFEFQERKLIFRRFKKVDEEDQSWTFGFFLIKFRVKSLRYKWFNTFRWILYDRLLILQRKPRSVSSIWYINKLFNF